MKWLTLILLIILILPQSMLVSEQDATIIKNTQPKFERLPLTVDITAYSPDSLETDDTPGITSTGEPVKFGIVAFSQDLIKRFGYDVWVHVPGFGDLFQVKDCMHEKWQNRIDIYFPTKEDALNFGIKHNQTIHVVTQTK